MIKASVVKNWKTSSIGVLQFIQVLAITLIAQFDAPEAATDPNWNLVITSLIAMVGLLFARDGDKSSEDSGIKPGGREPFIK